MVLRWDPAIGGGPKGEEEKGVTAVRRRAGYPLISVALRHSRERALVGWTLAAPLAGM